MDAERFWGMSLAEILAAVESHGRREKLRSDEFITTLRQYAGLFYRHAQLVSVATWNGKKYPRRIEEAFPGLFGETNESKAVPLWKKQQASMAAWVEAYNERIRRQKGVAGHGSSADSGDQG